ncbi:MAG: molybdopterin-dependent oxidoreductase, partial [Candidatus Omnitrophica bacterium]|nr:molybdopterin-dependent oxidoreductase [Candidatus Omnitrophota bacterium]
ANIHNCSYYCHQASGVALSKIYGSGTSSIVLDDLAKADLALVAGSNPASNHPRLITQLVNLRRRGGKVIVVNPLKELGLVRFRIPSDWRSMLFSSRVSDLYLQPHVGADIALFKALLKGVIERGGVDMGYVREHTSGWGDVEADLAGSSWEDLIDACGVPKSQVERAVELILRAKRGVFLWAMGLTHHVHGVDNIFALGNLALARGWLGKPGTGLLPVRGHSNVQGVGSIGVSPAVRQAFAAKLEELYGIRVPENPGQDTFASMMAAEAGKIRAAVLLGGNLFASNPDREWASRALRNIPFTAYISTKLNEGHIHGRGRTTLILPPLARDEESQATTQESMFNFVRMSEGGTPSVQGELRSEVEIIASLAERILPESRFNWKALRSHAHLRAEIAKVVPGYSAIAEIERAGGEFQIEGRTFHTPEFKTPDGKAHFHVTPLPEFAPAKGEFRLMTLRSEGQFNTVVYEEFDLYRGNDRRDVVMLSEEDARILSIAEGERVRVETEVGAMEVHAAIVDIAPGNLAMYYPEANAIVPRRIDSRSKTPAFKSIRARIRKRE